MDEEVGSEPVTHRVDHDPPLWVAPRPEGWRSRLDQPDQIERWLTRHAVGPCSHDGVEVRVAVAPTHLHDAEAWNARGTCMVAGFHDGAAPRNDAAAPLFHTSDLEAADERWASLETLLAEVSHPPLRVLVLPELSVTTTQRARALDALAARPNPPLLTVPGTWHEIEKGNRFNVAHLVDRDGETLLCQRKIQPILLDRVREQIEPGTALELLDHAGRGRDRSGRAGSRSVPHDHDHDHDHDHAGVGPAVAMAATAAGAG